ncbi:ATPase family AAA domain-containing protein 2-like isoform X1 [Gadus chalcogrammus]|uniref:ATPase family AAA domain-containing protein 2-like isoform X1 n=1 Tax=Gadus chalcogrammus TaxID=1042646 RepID=UPI0024C4E3CD|nr:ATPase family AAA domain-containing protein 2-like isoform X1 [Gadus chalcogrammus]
MVFLRSGGSGVAKSATSFNRSAELNVSSEFLSLVPAFEKRSVRSATRSTRSPDDSPNSGTDIPINGHAVVMERAEGKKAQEETSFTRNRRVKLETSFSKMNGTTSPSLTDDKAGVHCTRKSPRLQGEGKASSGRQQADVSDEVECSSTPKRCRFSLRSRQVDEEEEEEEEGEDHSVRRSSRITRLDSRKQSVLYDRLITNTAEAVLQKMDDMQKMRRRVRNRDRDTTEELGMYSSDDRRRHSLRTALKTIDAQEKVSKDVEKEDDKDDNVVKEGEVEEEEGEDEDEGEEGEEEEDGDEDDDDDDEEGEDEEGDNQKRYDFRKRKAVDRYQAPQKEPKEIRKRSLYFKGHSSPTRRRFRFNANAPRSPYSRRRSSRSSSERRRHAIHNSDSTLSSDSSSSDSSSTFQRRRSKTRSKPVNRCLPMNLVKEDLLGIQKDRMKIGASLADVDPMQIDKTVCFDSIGGLGRHISSLKEMVVFPLLYPEVFEKFKIQPPRGCLFYGPPGTGKTLVARALANECSQGDKKVAFFMRKGADCLSKWVGESERQLRLLFDQAYQMRPAIIFFDEIDGLAPVRSSRQDQIHSSIVSTLLALMDGLDSRGEVIVIGATNRLDSIDPALRRPGRFDREYLFGLPDRVARKDILKIHTKQWSPPPCDAFLEELADKCVGYCGADIKAVCSEAALCALRRRYPQIYSSSQKLVLDVDSITIGSRDFLSAMTKMVPAAQRAVVTPARALIPALVPLLGASLHSLLDTLARVFPHVELGLKKRALADLPCGVPEDDEVVLSEDEEGPSPGGSQPQPKTPAAQGRLDFTRTALSQPTSYRPRLLLEGRPGSGQSSHLAPAALHALEKFTVHTLDVAVLFGASTAAPEEACAQMFLEAKRTSPSILYVPLIGQWWEAVGPALRATFLSLLRSIPSFSPILLLATCNLPYHRLSPELKELFCLDYGEVFNVPAPSSRERRDFFEDLILNQAAKAPASKKRAVLQSLEVLPVAPPSAPRQLTKEEAERLEEQEEATWRELRLFLRDVTNRLSLDKRFKAFTKPVDLEEVEDYAEVIKEPMDLATVLSKIDRHQYGTAREFLYDVDLIWKNCLEYNPDRDPSDRQIRHRACALKDTVHAIIKHELDEDFEKICEEIKESRSNRDWSTSRSAPSFYHVLPKQPKAFAAEAKACDVAPALEPVQPACANSSHPLVNTTPKNTAQKKKRRRSRWSKGVISKKRSTCSPHTPKDGEEEEEEAGGTESDEGSAGEREMDQSAQEEGEDGRRGGLPTEAGPQDASPKPDNSPPTQNNTGATDDGIDHPAGGQSSGSGGQDVDLKEASVEEQSDVVTSEAEGDLAPPKETDPAEPMDVGGCEGGIAAGSDGCAPPGRPAHDDTTGKTEEESHADASTALPLVSESSVRRVTRGLKSAVQQQQQQMVEADAAVLAPVEKTPPLEVDRNKLKDLLEKVVLRTARYEVRPLEKLYALLCQSIYRHRREYNKATLLKEMEQEIDDLTATV